MRFVKFTLLGLIGITLTFISLGFFHSNFQYENQIEVDASVEKSYATFINDSLASQWLIGYVGNEVLSGAPLRPGSRFLMKFEQEGQTTEMIEELKEIKENEKFIFDLETSFFTRTVEVYFEGNNEKSTITAYSTMTGSNILYQSMLYILKSGLQKQSQTNYDLLKELIEKQN
jgi:hypothetical protein